MTLCNQGKAVHSSHVTMDDMENAMTVVCVTMLISMPTPIIGVKFHFHSFRFVYLSAFCTRRRKEYFQYDFCCSPTSIQVKRFSFTGINSYTESQSFCLCSRSLV